MKKLFFVLSMAFFQLINYAQRLPMFSDSATVGGSPQFFFAAHRETIQNGGITRCSVFRFSGKNLADSTLHKTIWFDVFGNKTKSTFGANPNQDYADTCMYDANNRLAEIRYMNGKKCIQKTQYTYLGDTIEIAYYHNYYEGDTFYFPGKHKKFVMKVMKPGSDTSYARKIYNQNNQLAREISLDNKRNFTRSTEYVYDAKGLPVKSYSVDKKKHKTNKFLYTYEFLNGRYTIMMWNNNGNPQPAAMVCVYQNDQCIDCRQPYDLDTQFFYTREGLLSGEIQTSNSGDYVVFKYYYS